MYDCAVPGCKAKGVHNFPRNEQFRKLWEIAAKTHESKIYNPTKTCKICATHFKPDDYFKEGFYTGVKNKKRILKKNVIPTRFPWNTKKKSLLKKMGLLVEKKDTPENTETKSDETKDVTPTTSVTSQNQGGNVEKMDEDMPPSNVAVPQNPDEIMVEHVPSAISIIPQDPDPIILEMLPDTPSTVAKFYHNLDNNTEIIDKTSTVPTVSKSEDVKITESQILEAIQAESKQDKTQLRLIRQKNKQLISVDKFKTDNQELHSQTGLESFEKFMAVFATLGSEVYFLQSRRNIISAEDQFLLTLIKLSQNIEDEKLGKQFSIPTATATNIFITWVDFLYEKWKMIKCSPERMEILVSPEDYLSQLDRSDGQKGSTSTDKKGKKTKPKKKGKGDQDISLPVVPDTIPEGVSKTFTILLSSENIKHVSRPKLYLVCKILCCFIDNTINPAMCYNQV